MDCMDGMKETPDKYFDLAIVDPPYGINMDNPRKRTKPSRPNSYELYKEYRYKEAEWDGGIPKKQYFNELFRVSKKQLIFGANYMAEHLPSGYGWVFWHKKNGEDNNFSDGEFIFSSKGIQSRMVSISQFDGLRGGQDRIHPTQKPVALYHWLLNNYAEEGDKILDTHVGSASSLIACHDMGFEYLGFELDEDYYNMASERLERHKAQLKLF